jgi:hypothetical protein
MQDANGGFAARSQQSEYLGMPGKRDGSYSEERWQRLNQRDRGVVESGAGLRQGEVRGRRSKRIDYKTLHAQDDSIRSKHHRAE